MRSEILLTASIILQSFSFLSLKIGSRFESWGLSLLFIATAFSFLLMRAWLWQLILKRHELSTVFPFSSFVHVLIVLYAVFLFGESLTYGNIAGLAVMILGLFIISRRGRQ
jgi:multidrug transporter EmrE-like cation transporter